MKCPNSIEMSVSTVKGIRFGYEQNIELLSMLNVFRDMVNNAIRICLMENIKGRLNLRDRIYREFIDRYGLASQYPYSVAEIAWSIVKKHKLWHRTPHAKHLMMKLDSSAYTIKDGMLSLAFRPGRNAQRIVYPVTSLLRYVPSKHLLVGREARFRVAPRVVILEILHSVFDKVLHGVFPLQRAVQRCVALRYDVHLRIAEPVHI